ncbi:MAG: M20/M25/M40 family metallo-hydrolase, partial [Chloroflexota bacterium]
MHDYSPIKIAQHLIRFNTTNPPGDEAACVAYVDQLLRAAGFETVLICKDPERPNLIARLKGRGEAPPLLIQGHVDVVTTEGQDWTHPPFEGVIKDGVLWGRGALDMKGAVA